MSDKKDNNPHDNPDNRELTVLVVPKNPKILPSDQITFFPYTSRQFPMLKNSLAKKIIEEGCFVFVPTHPENFEIPKIGALAYIQEYIEYEDGFVFTADIVQRIHILEYRPCKIDEDDCFECTRYNFADDTEIPKKLWEKDFFNIKQDIKSVGELFQKFCIEIMEFVDKYEPPEEEIEETTLAVTKFSPGPFSGLKDQLQSAPRNNIGKIVDKMAGYIEILCVGLNMNEEIPLEFLTHIRNVFFEIYPEKRLKKLCLFLEWLIKDLEGMLADQEFNKEGGVKTMEGSNKDPVPTKPYQIIKDRYEKIKHKIPPEAKEEFEKELARLKRGMHSSEASMVYDHLEDLLQLFSLEETKENTNLKDVKRVLDEDHYGLDSIKNSILEYLSIRPHVEESESPILCIIGPPGTGKTSIARSVARALGRKYVRLALGGVRDEAEIFGHGQTYIQTKPGQIIKNLLRAKSKNPVFVLDEIDKISNDGFRGDPASALLAVLDPEQNNQFFDHNINVPFDLSRILFICTGNTTATVPQPLLDRMEVLRISGYTHLEKEQIATRYLIPKQKKKNGLPFIKDVETLLDVEITNEAIQNIIKYYTYEAGVRALEQKIRTILRKIVKKYELGELDASQKIIEVTGENLRDFCGKPALVHHQSFSKMPTGCVPMFAVSEMGGHFFYVEARLEWGRDRKKIKVTGVRGSSEAKERLNNVLEESIDVAFDALTLEGGILHDKTKKKKHRGEIYIHVHIRNGATPKDGPSAGIPMIWLIFSLLMDEPIQPQLGVTGECDLVLGKLLPVGGIRDKAFAAYKAGIKTFIIPKDNEADIDDIPEEIKSKIDIQVMDSVWDTLILAFPKYKNEILQYLEKNKKE